VKVTIQGEWKTGRVYFDGEELSKPRHWESDPEGLRFVSGRSFSWGTASYESSQLALYILLRVFSVSYALKFWHAFFESVVAQLPQTDFKVEVDLGEWLAKQQLHHRDTEGTEKETPG
jgi:hypothetical protein